MNWIQRQISEPTQNANNPLAKKVKTESSVNELKIPEFILQLLNQRGISTGLEIKSFLYPQISQLADPYKIRNMDLAVDRIFKAFLNQEKVLIYGDFDLDGTFGLTLVYEAFAKLGFKNLVAFQPSRHKDGYGLHSNLIQELNEQHQIQLIITVDVGITAVESVSFANSLGIDVIITDHHLPQKELPAALAILNPNVEGDSSGLGYLCGAGVGFYLVRAVRKKLVDSGISSAFDLKELLPYFAIATVTDMVPLVQDNRLLLKYAFDAFAKTTNLGLRQLLAELQLSNKKLDTEDIGIKLAPKINALSRLDKNRKPMDLLFQKNEIESQKFVDSLIHLNIQRKELQETGIKAVKDSLQNPGQFIFYYSSEIHPGVTGLIANYFSTEMNIPCFIGSLDLESQCITGSARKSDQAEGNLSELMEILQSDSFHGGGHACAVGFEFKITQLEKVQSVIKNYFYKLDDSQINHLDSATPVAQPNFVTTHYDLEIKWNHLKPELISWLYFLEPYGVGFTEPKFLMKNISFLNLILLKNRHFKMIAHNPLTQEKLEFLLFNPSERQKMLIMEGIEQVDVLVKLKKDKFRGTNRIQFLIEDIKRHEFITTT